MMKKFINIIEEKHFLLIRSFFLYNTEIEKNSRKKNKNITLMTTHSYCYRAYSHKLASNTQDNPEKKQKSRTTTITNGCMHVKSQKKQG